MTISLDYYCYSCNYLNKSRLGLPGFEPLYVTYDTFSDAVRHVIENSDHHMELRVRIDEDEE